MVDGQAEPATVDDPARRRPVDSTREVRVVGVECDADRHRLAVADPEVGDRLEPMGDQWPKSSGLASATFERIAALR